MAFNQRTARSNDIDNPSARPTTSQARRPATVGASASALKSNLKPRPSLSSLTDRQEGSSEDTRTEKIKTAMNGSAKRSTISGTPRATSPTKSSLGRRCILASTTNIEKKPTKDRLSTSTTRTSKPTVTHQTVTHRSTRPIGYSPQSSPATAKKPKSAPALPQSAPRLSPSPQSRLDVATLGHDSPSPAASNNDRSPQIPSLEADLQTKVDDYQAEIGNLNKESTLERLARIDADAQCGKLTHEVADLRRTLEEERAHHQVVLKDLEEHNSDLSNQLEHTIDSKDTAYEQLKNELHAIQIHKDQLAAAATSVQASEFANKLEATMTKLINLDSASKDCVRKWELHVAALMRKILQLENLAREESDERNLLVQLKDGEIAELRFTVGALEADRDALAQDKAERDTWVQFRDDDITELRDTIGDMEALAHDKDDEIKNLGIVIENLQNKILEIHASKRDENTPQRFSDGREEIAKLEEIIEELKRENRSIWEKADADMEETIARLDRQNEWCRWRGTEANQQLWATDNAHRKAKAEIESLKAELAQLKETLNPPNPSHDHPNARTSNSENNNLGPSILGNVRSPPQHES